MQIDAIKKTAMKKKNSNVEVWQKDSVPGLNYERLQLTFLSQLVDGPINH